MYKRRQAIVEHPYGTIKRSWGCYYTLLRRKDKVKGEMAIAFTVYNLRRVMSILGVAAMIEALKGAFFAFFGRWPSRVRVMPPGLPFVPWRLVLIADGKKRRGGDGWRWGGLFSQSDGGICAVCGCVVALRGGLCRK